MKSYRIFKGLETSDQERVKELQRVQGYTLADYTLLLYAKSGKKLSLKEAFQLALKKQSVIREKILDIQRRDLYFSIKDPNQRIKALRFHGFKTPEELPKRFLRKGYAYITSNSLIQGKLYIFPQRLYDDIKYKDAQTPNWQSVFEDLILPGIIRVYYSFEYKSLKTSYERSQPL